MPNKRQSIIFSKHHGYSLLELMIVVAIIGTLSLSVKVSLSQANYRLKSAARDLYANMQVARMEAVKRNSNWGIIFNKTANSYSICAYDNGACVGDNTTIKLGDYDSGIQFGYGNATKNATSTGGKCPDKCSSLNGGISYSTNSVYFDPKGLSPKRGYTYLENDKKSSFTIATPYPTGSVVIRQWVCSTFAADDICTNGKWK